MTEEQLIAIIEKVRTGVTVERSSLDLKRKWWHLDNQAGLDEFYKDVCSMANSQGGDSTIVIGVDEEGKIYDAPLPLDEADIQSKHKDQIEPRVKLLINEIKIEGKMVSVITIPHSANRPHVIKKYHDRHNWIPVRFGTSTLTASRLDLDEMYQERFKSNSSDLHARLYDDKVRWGNYPLYGGWSFMVLLSLDNYGGGAPDYIIKAVLHETKNNHWKTSFFMFEGMELNQEFKIDSHERKQAVQLYLAGQPPERALAPEMPALDRESLVLSLYTRSGDQINIDIHSSWVETKQS